MEKETVHVRPLRVSLAPRSKAEKGFYSRAVMPRMEARAPGLPATPAHDLIYHGGKIIPKLEYVNFYVGGKGSWRHSDIQSIDTALASAMSDPHLNNVMGQYFRAGGISTTFLGSHVLSGSKPAVVSQGDVENMVKRLFRAGKLKNFDLSKTVVNFFLPSGTLLNTDEAPTSGAVQLTAETGEGSGDSPIPHEEEDSTEGLGGYHGSIHIGHPPNRRTIYYAVGVFSERRPDGTENGIVVFDQPWKNVVATFYHELNEARTDPDVEDAIQAGDDANAVKFLGWTSRQGEECGDFPVFEANPLTLVFKEVALTQGGGTVPVQFQYSNAVHGPEGPIPNPDPPLLHATAAAS
jgi:hypothetical protein